MKTSRLASLPPVRSIYTEVHASLLQKAQLSDLIPALNFQGHKGVFGCGWTHQIRSRRMRAASRLGIGTPTPISRKAESIAPLSTISFSPASFRKATDGIVSYRELFKHRRPLNGSPGLSQV